MSLEIHKQLAEIRQQAGALVGNRYLHPVKGAGTIKSFDAKIGVKKPERTACIICTLRIEYDKLWEFQISNCGREYDLIQLSPKSEIDNLELINA